MQTAASIPQRNRDPIEVSIQGQRYTIKSNLESHQVRQLASYVDRVMKEIRKHTQTYDPNRVAILAALNIAEDLFRVRGRCTEAAQRVTDLIELIDEKCSSKLE